MQFKQVNLKNAVILRHEHENIENVLEKLSENENGNLMFEGKVFASSELTTELLENIFAIAENKNNLEEKDNLILVDINDFKSQKTSSSFLNTQFKISGINYASAGRGIIAGGVTNSVKSVSMESFDFCTLSNSQYFADLKCDKNGTIGNSLSNSFLIIMFGSTSSSNIYKDNTESVSFSSLVQTTIFGSKPTNLTMSACCSNKNDGYAFGGSYENVTLKNIYKISFAAACDFSFLKDLDYAFECTNPCGSGAGNEINGFLFNYVTRDIDNLLTNNSLISNFTYSTETFYSNFGTLVKFKRFCSSGSNKTKALICGGDTADASSFYNDCFDLTTKSNSTHFTGIIASSAQLAQATGIVDEIKFFMCGGVYCSATSVSLAKISNYVFSNLTAIADFANLSVAKNQTVGNSNSHGGC